MLYKCSKCKEEKTEDQFHKKNGGTNRKISYYCKDCQSKFCADFRLKNKEKIAKDKQEYILRIKSEGIKSYGGKCMCCGETQEKFLTIDHINGRIGEEKDKRIYWAGKKMWAKLKKLDYPTENYQLLCFNCNSCKHIYGICPHQTKYKE